MLTLGRTVRLATRAQRRALRVRDRNTCQFPGCTTSHHLDAHHLVPWSAGGATDLDNLILLCRRHHTFVHEGGVTITAGNQPSRFTFMLADGSPFAEHWFRQSNDEVILWRLQHLAKATASDDPSRIFPRQAGAGFSLHECVRVLCERQRPAVAIAA
ncbi:HNH endonuclease [Aestuariimicrobium ganziense]|uniref:HNH endonuclease n=1 Tax=Aestuariimicrobium ganziense TaxID=2773677 RepID=UPI0019415DD5|nr:HNH endonuclease signature motif containing protein [Aestuariimicrobium ganziense]